MFKKLSGQAGSKITSLVSKLKLFIGGNMIEYRVIGVCVNLVNGNLKLNEDQYRRRKHVLKPMGDGIYKIVLTARHNRVQFKRGETIGYDGLINKGLLQSLCPEKEVTEKDEMSRENKIIGAMDECIKQGHVTKTGLPELPMVNEMLDFIVSGKERDRLFKKHFEATK